MQNTFAKLLGALVVPVVVTASLAGTLDHAPFRVALPSGDWKLDDSTAKDLGKDVFLVASLIYTNAQLKSVVVKAKLKKDAESSLDELCAGIRDSFGNPAVKKKSDTETTFLSHKARRFVYEVTQGDQTTYNEAVVFIAANSGWTIACVGRPDQKDEVKRIFTFYVKKDE